MSYHTMMPIKNYKAYAQHSRRIVAPCAMEAAHAI